MSGGARAELRATIAPGYRVGEVMGEGATGLVFAATRRSDGLCVALKRLKPALAHRADLTEALLREAEVARALRHPGMARVLDTGLLEDGSPFVAFEPLCGESLSSLLQRTHSLPSAQALLVTKRLAQVLSAVHAAGYVHRDVKPEHVALSASSGKLEVRLIDFGVCQAPGVGPGCAGRTEVFGTPGYMSPEQVRGDRPVDGRSDVYALGVVLYECLRGELPFSGANSAVLMRRALSEEAPALEPRAYGLPRELCTLVSGLLAREPEVRPPNARTVARLVSGMLRDERPAEYALAAQLWPRFGLGARLDDLPTRRVVAAAG